MRTKEVLAAGVAIALLAAAALSVRRYKPSESVPAQSSLPVMPEFRRTQVVPDRQAGKPAAIVPPQPEMPPRKTEIPPPSARASAKSGAAETAVEKPRRAESSAVGAAKLKMLESIIDSGNDNDSRLDSAFNNLSPATKSLFRREYSQTPPEDLNGRGTLVYALGGKNLASKEDWAFLRGVVREQPCRSLGNCAQDGPHDSIHPAEEFALSYPAMVALRQAENVLADHNAGRPMENEAFAVGQAMDLIRAAKESKSPMVAERAAELERMGGNTAMAGGSAAGGSSGSPSAGASGSAGGPASEAAEKAAGGGQGGTPPSPGEPVISRRGGGGQAGTKDTHPSPEEPAVSNASAEELGLPIDSDVPSDMRKRTLAALAIVAQFKGQDATPGYKEKLNLNQLDGKAIVANLKGHGLKKIGMARDCGPGAMACVEDGNPTQIGLTPSLKQLPTTTLAMVLLHEGNHAGADRPRYLHDFCPASAGSNLAGGPFCDFKEDGSYGFATRVMGNVAKFCETCTGKVTGDARDIQREEFRRLYGDAKKKVGADLSSK
ncbi:MAG: hypothetical protein PHP45_06235 [Elusimicrobiales bacterium]|nr:hypothetical protein [Elusimicrobiales bacterium]